MLKKLGAALAVVVVALAAFVATRPDEFRVTRSAELNAPAAAIYPLINNLHGWETWSPYLKLDPAMKGRFDGPEEGPGAIFAWEGNAKAGAGRMTIIETVPNRLVSIRLEFTKPFAATDVADFKLEPTGAGTRVTWTMSGRNNVLCKLMSPFMDKMVGKAFEEGLVNLNAAAKAPAAGS